MTPSLESRPELWAIGGGKGGTGKSLLAASLGIHFAERGRRVVLVDGDLGTPNLHTFVGVDAPVVSLSDVIARRVASLEDAAVETGIDRLRLVSSARNALDADSLRHFQKTRLLRLLPGLDADVVVIDLGAGTSLNVLDLFAMADRSVLVILPEPTSVENCYRFLRAAYLRRLQNLCRVLGHQPLVDLILRHRAAAPSAATAILEEIARIDSAVAADLEAHLATFAPGLVVNQARDHEDAALGDAMQAAAARFARLPMRFLGTVPYDPVLVRCLKTRRPFLREYPRSRTAEALRAVALAAGLPRREAAA